MNDHPPQPAIILVRPQLGENIGTVARAMLNFGLTDLRLVNPRDGWPNPDAGPAAAGADLVLAQTQVFATLAEAAHDCGQLLATTVRRRDIVKPVLDPAEAASQVRASTVRTAYIFGAERSGLDTDDVAMAHAIVTVPINPEFPSLNLAQAVILMAYEWSKGSTLASPAIKPIDAPAPQQDVDALVQAFDAALEPAGYFHPPHRNAVTRRSLRMLLTKPGWSAKEISMMRGVLTALLNPRQR